MNFAPARPKGNDMHKPSDPVNGYCDYDPVTVGHASSGPLAGLTLAVKDIYAVKGYPSGWGSPTRLAEAEAENITAPAIQQLLDAGARCTGKSHCDELCYSLNGINAHYGAPINHAAPARITGGSSCGSAALVAAGAVDIATGSDTGGSVRAPASYCGLIGLRTTHGRILLDKTMPLAPSLDVFGWFARSMEIYQRVGDVLLNKDASDTPFSRPIVITTLNDCLLGEAERLAYQPAFDRVAGLLGEAEVVPGFNKSLDDWYWSMRYLQAYEAWQQHGDWIRKSKPDLGPGVKDRFEFGIGISADEYADHSERRRVFRKELVAILGEDGVLIMPTAPSAAPLKNASHDSLQEFRENALHLLCVSGLSGFPQITLPLASVYDAPFGLSLLGPAGSDQRLIALAARIMGS